MKVKLQVTIIPSTSSQDMRMMIQVTQICMT